MAYGTNAPFGLRPVRYADGSPWNGALNQYNIASEYATSLFTGDPVTTLSDGTIGIGVAGAACRGVFMGVKYVAADGTIVPGGGTAGGRYWPGATATFGAVQAVALVADDPNLIFSVQEANAAGTGAGTPLALADRGLNINFAVGTGSTATGQSGAYLNNETEADTATLNLKIIDLDPYTGNAVGSFANWLVAWNNHQFKGGTGTAGV